MKINIINFIIDIKIKIYGHYKIYIHFIYTIE